MPGREQIRRSPDQLRGCPRSQEVNRATEGGCPGSLAFGDPGDREPNRAIPEFLTFRLYHRLTGRNPQLSITALSMNRDRASLSVSWLLSGPFPAQPRH